MKTNKTKKMVKTTMKKTMMAAAVALVMVLGWRVTAAEPLVAIDSTITSAEAVTVSTDASSVEYVVAYTADTPALYCEVNATKGRDCADVLAGEGLFLSGAGRLYRDAGGAWRVALLSYTLGNENVDN